MNLTINEIGGAIGITTAIAYSAWSFHHSKSKPDLSTIFVIILSCVGLATGAFLSYSAVVYDPIQLGDLAEHKIPILIGGVGVLYVSLEAIIGCFLRGKGG